MHIEPGLVDGAKMAVGFATAAGLLGLTLREAAGNVMNGNAFRLIAGTAITLLVTLFSFEVLPHPTVGVSEVHLILGATLLLLFGAIPVALGMASGLFLQGLFFEPADMVQYGMNVTTLLASLFVTSSVAKRLIPAGVKLVDITRRDVVKLSVIFQGSVVAWVAFWVVLGQGLSVASLQSIVTFGLAYSVVVVVEVLVSLALLVMCRAHKGMGLRRMLNPRLFQATVA
jgi:ABC-type Co2+ transport system permease subunit